ncbi:CHAT domain containing protein [Elaphomyces granulatus]
MDIEQFAAQYNEDIPDLLSALAIDAYERHRQSGGTEDIDIAIELAKQGIYRTANDNFSLIGWLNNLGIFLGHRYERTGEMKDLEEAIQAARQAVESTPADYPDQAGRLNNLGIKLVRRYERTGEMKDLEEAIQASRQAVESMPADHPDQATCLNNLGINLGHRYERTGEMKDLEEAIQTARQAAGRLNNLGNMLESRYERTGEMKDLEEAIQAARQAVASTPADHPAWAGRLNNLGNKLESRYERTGEMKDLEEAIQTARQAVESTPANHPAWAGRLNNLGNKLGCRYERTGEMKDLEEAIQTARQAVESMPADHPDQAACLNNLGNKLESRYERTGEMKDLEEAIQTARQAVESTPADHPARAGRLNNLGMKLESRYERTGEMKDLEEAIQTARQAVESTPADHPDQAGRLNNLGNQLKSRYERTGEMKDLEEAIQTARQAVESTPADHLAWAGRLNNLGNKLGCRYERTGEMKDLEEAIQTARQAVASTPANHPDQATWLNNLGIFLGHRYERTGEMKDLEEAIQTARQAVESTPADHPDQATWLDNLGNKLESRYEWTGEMKDLEEAIQTARQAVESTPAGHPDHAGRLNNLGNKLESRYERTGEMKDVEEALRYLYDAWDCTNSVPFTRVRAAARCLKILSTQHKLDAGINLGRAVLELLPTAHTRLLSRNDQQFVMSTFAGVASDLCSFFLASSRPNEALEYLEQGRGVIISQLLDRRTNLSDLIADHPTLARQYECLVNKVNTQLRQTTHDAAEVQATKQRREAAAELDACIRMIRGIPHHQRFLLGQTVAEMQECAGDSNVVVVNITEFRSDAILVSRNAIKTVLLSQLSASDTRAWLSKRWMAKKRSEQNTKNKEFLGTPEGLVDRNRAGKLDALPRSRITYEGINGNAYSKVISSYTPSIKTLAYAQNWARSTEEPHGSLLITTMPTTPRGRSEKHALKDLPGAIKEEDEIVKAAHDRITAIVLNQPSVKQVLKSLETCRIAHFACHGISDSLDPSNSGLILQKSSNEPGEVFEQDRLTAHRIAELQLGHTQIAYLSACSTAENKAARLSDEVIHVASGFQVAGFPHVVGCLWPAGDSECVEVARRFYSSVLRQSWSATGNGEVARALQEAVMAVRAEDINMPLNWAQFVHYGA